MIYRLCLIDTQPVSIEVKGPLDFIYQRFTKDYVHDNFDKVRLTTRNISTVNTSLVRINSTVGEEAAPILYGHNTFGFFGDYCWNDFLYFNLRLRKTSLENIRKIEIDFPDHSRLISASRSFAPASEWALEALQTLPALEALTLHLYEDIMTDDYAFWRKIRDGFHPNCQVAIESHGVRLIGEKCEEFPKSTVRISSRMLREIHEWGWSTKGDWEVVNQ